MLLALLLLVVVVYNGPPFLFWLLLGICALRICQQISAARGRRRLADQRIAAICRNVREPAPCRHDGAVEVESVAVPAVGHDPERVAWYCPACHAQLPATWELPVSTAIPGVNVERAAARLRAGMMIDGRGRIVEPGASVKWADPLIPDGMLITIPADGRPYVEAEGIRMYLDPAWIQATTKWDVKRCPTCPYPVHKGMSCRVRIRAGGYQAIDVPALGQPTRWVRGAALDD